MTNDIDQQISHLCSHGYVFNQEPCSEAVPCLEDNFKDFWFRNPRGDWLIWYALQLGVDKRAIIKCLVKMIEPSVSRPSRKASEMREILVQITKWTAGELDPDKIAPTRKEDSTSNPIASARINAVRALVALVRCSDITRANQLCGTVTALIAGVISHYEKKSVEDVLQEFAVVVRQTFSWTEIQTAMKSRL